MKKVRLYYAIQVVKIRSHYANKVVGNSKLF
jgi:hypothetical protein